MPDLIRIGDNPSALDIERAISALRHKACRLSRHDPRRTEIDVEVDALVELRLAMTDG